MCFTVNVNLVKEELERLYGRDFIDYEKYRPSYYYHAFSLPFLPVVVADYLKTMQWGLIPSWVKDTAQAEEIRKKTFNARSETISVKPSFAESFASRRCIVPVSGFFEWQQRGPNKIPWYITAASGDALSLGGIWNEWRGDESDATHLTFSIITTEANELMSEIHNTARRMPLVIGIDSVDRWLSPTISNSDLKTLMTACPADFLSAHKIGPLISSRKAEKNRQDLIAPYEYHFNGTLFD